jgi:hypothetical protein
MADSDDVQNMMMEFMRKIMMDASNTCSKDGRKSMLLKYIQDTMVKECTTTDSALINEYTEYRDLCVECCREVYRRPDLLLSKNDALMKTIRVCVNNYCKNKYNKAHEEQSHQFAGPDCGTNRFERKGTESVSNEYNDEGTQNFVGEYQVEDEDKVYVDDHQDEYEDRYECDDHHDKVDVDVEVEEEEDDKDEDEIGIIPSVIGIHHIHSPSVKTMTVSSRKKKS